MDFTPAIIPRTQPLLGWTTIGDVGQVAMSDGAGGLDWGTIDVSAAVSAGIATHVAAADPHTQYVLGAGRSGGQTINLGTGAGEGGTINSTGHGTRGTISLQGGSAAVGPDGSVSVLVGTQQQINLLPGHGAAVCGLRVGSGQQLWFYAGSIVSSQAIARIYNMGIGLPATSAIEFSHNVSSTRRVRARSVADAGDSLIVEHGSAATPSARFDNSSTSGNTRLLLWDVDKGALSRVSVGAADSGGPGFKILRVPN